MIKTAMSFALGCALFLQLPALPSLYWLLGLLLCIPLYIAKPVRWIAIVITGAAWTFIISYNTLNGWLPNEQIGKVQVITGTISSIPIHRNHHIVFNFKPDHSQQIINNAKIRLNWYTPIPTDITAGQRWQLSVKLKPPHGLSNPGGFNYERWLFQQRIVATGYVKHVSSNKQISAAPFYSINALRQRLANNLANLLPQSQYIGLIQGLSTGIKSEISTQQWHVLRATGTSHLLAISGLHIGLLAAIGFWVCRALWSLRSANLLLLPATHAGAIGGFISALFYAALAGFAIPTQRALIMLAVLLVAILIKRTTSPSHILATSLLIISILDPISILSAGLWLSFSAVAIILLISQGRYPAPRYQWLKIHIVLAFALSPLLFMFFSKASLIAPIANIIAVPFISILIVPLTLMASCISFLLPTVSQRLLQLADVLIHYCWYILTFLSNLPYSEVAITPLSKFHWFAVILGICLLVAPRGFPAKWLGILGLLPLFFVKPYKPEPNEFWFTLLDVGQGLSAVIQTHRHTLLFDAGPKFGTQSDTGKTVVIPFLRRQGISHIDTFIVSHGDNDHIGGAKSVLDELPIDSLLTSVPHHFNQADHCYSGTSWHWDGVTFEIIHPHQTDQLNSNNNSCVLKVSVANKSVLLTGDIEVQAEQLLIKRYNSQLASTLLIAPHHGSNTSSSLAFIHHINPEIVFFPTGFTNRFGFPASKVVKRYDEQGIVMMSTADLGAIQFKVTKEGYSEPRSWRQHTQKIGSYPPKLTE